MSAQERGTPHGLPSHHHFTNRQLVRGGSLITLSCSSSLVLEIVYTRQKNTDKTLFKVQDMATLIIIHPHQKEETVVVRKLNEKAYYAV